MQRLISSQYRPIANTMDNFKDLNHSYDHSICWVDRIVPILMHQTTNGGRDLIAYPSSLLHQSRGTPGRLPLGDFGVTWRRATGGFGKGKGRGRGGGGGNLGNGGSCLLEWEWPPLGSLVLGSFGSPFGAGAACRRTLWPWPFGSLDFGSVGAGAACLTMCEWPFGSFESPFGSPFGTGGACLTMCEWPPGAGAFGSLGSGPFAWAATSPI